MGIRETLTGMLRPTSVEKLRDVARVYHDAGARFDGEGAVKPTREEYLATSDDTGVSVAVLQTIWQIESRQLALLNGEPLKRIEGGKWVKFGGDKRDLPKPLNPGGDTPATTITGQRVRLSNFEKLMEIDPQRAIFSTSHGGPQIMGWWAERCGFKDALAFYTAQKMGAGMQLVAMARFIRHPKCADLRKAMIDKDVPAISFHWNGPRYRDNAYDTKLAAGLRKFA